MKARLFFSILYLFCVLSSKAQLVLPAVANTQTMVFFPSVTFYDTMFYNYGYPIDTYIVQLDTTNCGIWQIGGSNKPVFSPVGSYLMHGIMTDTIGSYPVNVNSSFIIKANFSEPNIGMAFWHRYETDSGHDGGVVEFSVDSGANWANVIGCDPYDYRGTINTENYYGAGDTLSGGIPAFSGNSGGEVESILQIVNCYAYRTMTRPCYWLDSADWEAYYSPDIWFRFRFVSDSIPDAYSGWFIDSVIFYASYCPGSVATAGSQPEIKLSPDPASSSVTITTGLNSGYTIWLYNMLGQQVVQANDCQPVQQLDVSSLPAGVYQVVLMDADHQRYYERLVISH